MGITAIEVCVCSSAKTLGDPGNGCDDQKMEHTGTEHLVAGGEGGSIYVSARIYILFGKRSQIEGSLALISDS